MGLTGALAPHNPLSKIKLDPKSFVQLTVWIAMVLLAYAAARWAISYGQSKVGQLTGKQSATGSSNPFFG